MSRKVDLRLLLLQISFKLLRDPVMLPTGHSCVFPSSLPVSYGSAYCVTLCHRLRVVLMSSPGRTCDLCWCRSYERRYIERWLEQGNMRCPATGTALTRPVALTPNVSLRRSIEDWAEQHAIWLLVSPRQCDSLHRWSSLAAFPGLHATDSSVSSVDV